MIELISVPAILAKPHYMGGAWLNTGRNWQRSEEVALKALCHALAPVEKSADGLGRSPTSIAYRAQDAGLKLPPEWRDIIRQKRRPALVTPAGAYPYIVKVRGEHQELLAVNALVSRGLPDHMRGDICQEIMLALWQKETTIEELQADARLVQQFVRGFRKANLETGGYAISLDAPLQDGRSWYDILPGASSDDNGYA